MTTDNANAIEDFAASLTDDEVVDLGKAIGEFSALYDETIKVLTDDQIELLETHQPLYFTDAVNSGEVWSAGVAAANSVKDTVVENLSIIELATVFTDMRDGYLVLMANQDIDPTDIVPFVSQNSRIIITELALSMIGLTE